MIDQLGIFVHINLKLLFYSTQAAIEVVPFLAYFINVFDDSHRPMVMVVVHALVTVVPLFA